MKKLLLAGVVLSSSLFATSLEQKVNDLEKRVSVLEKKLNVVTTSQKKMTQTITKVTSSQKTIETNIQKGLIYRCDKIKLKDYSFIYNGGFMPTYDFTYKIKNGYKKAINYVYGTIVFTDNDETDLLQDYIKGDFKIDANKTKTIKTNYLITPDTLAEYVKDTPKKDLHVEFKPFMIKFADGTKINCN